MVAKEGIRETALGAEVGLDRVAMRKRRNALSRGADWWKDGAAIIWGEEAAGRLRESLGGSKGEVPEVIEEIPEEKSLQVVKLPPNDGWVLCNESGRKIKVKVKKGAGRKMLGKTIRVQLRNGTWNHKP